MRINGVYVRRSRSRVAKAIQRADVKVSHVLGFAGDAAPRRTKILRARMMASTGKTTIVPPVFANVGVQMRYQAALEHLVHEMYFSSRIELLPVLMDTPPIIAPSIAHDAKPTAAGIMFWCGNKLLLTLRNDPGYESWGIPGGGIESGETPEDAARRETLEETQYIVAPAPLEYVHTHQYRTTYFVTFRREVPEMFTPILNDEHTAFRWVTRLEASRMPLHPGVVAAFTNCPWGVAMDAAGPTKQLQRALEKWGTQWIDKFDLMAQRISLDFAQQNQRATETAVQGAFKKAGFTVPFKPTRASIEAYKSVAAEQIGLIKSIAQKYHTDVQTMVWESVKRGGDMRTLSKDLTAKYGVSKRRAALIARDQNSKAKAVFEAVRHQELGIKQGIWMHSHAGKEPRPTHVKMNNKLYDLDKGMWDEDEGEWVQPGELINCRCTMRPFIPGFEDVRPEWDIVQT